MGIIENGVNGPFSGKAGSVIGSSWRKINYIKGVPQVRKTRVTSPKQAIQRQKFKLLNDFLLPIASLLELGFGAYTAKATGRNSAFRFNYNQAFTADGDMLALNYPALQFSQGSLCAAGAEKAWLEDGDLHVAWNPKTYGMGGAIDDAAYVVAYSPSEDFFVSNEAAGIRQDGATRIELQGLNISGGLHVWLFFADRRQKQVSNTVYIPLSEAHS